ncbi:MAG: hypothetical protein ACREMR_11060 [Gemmatimonadales bacterium]
MLRCTLLLACGAALGCGRDRPMADMVEMPHADSTMLGDRAKLDSMLDTMPGGEMARGSDSAASKLMRKKAVSR